MFDHAKARAINMKIFGKPKQLQKSEQNKYRHFASNAAEQSINLHAKFV